MSEKKTARILGKLDAFTRISEKLSIVRLRAPHDYSWSAGQYLALSDQAEGGETGYYSIASAPGYHSPGEFELAISGASAFSRGQWRRGLSVWLSPAQGKLPIARLALSPRVVLIAMGTGVAPMRAVIQELRARNRQGPKLTLVHGSRKQGECLHFDEMMSLGETLDYRPVFSQPEESWEGRRGRVQEHMRDLHTQGSEFCLCGSREMVADVKKTLAEMGVPTARIFSDGG